MTTRRLPTRYNRAMALEPRILLDAAATATAAAVVEATDTKPGVTATPVDATISIKDTDTKQSVDLFSAVSVTSDQNSETMSSLVITVNATGSNQALVIDGTTITLTANANGDSTANNGYYYSVAVSGNTTTITLSIASSDANTNANVASLIDSISYSTLDNTVESATVTVTLSSLTDTGSDSADLNISSTITVTSDINVAPDLVSDNPLEAAESFSASDLGDSTEVVYSSDGKYAYVAGENSLSVFSVDATGRLTLTQSLTGLTDLGTVSEMAISSDGKSIYTTSADSEQIVQFSVASDGTVTYVGTTNTSNGLASGGLTLSEDGAWAYVGTQWNGVAIFSRDTTTGALTYVALAPDNFGRDGVMATVGDYVYVMYSGASHTLMVFSRNDDGTLSQVSSLTTTTNSSYGAVDYAIEVSADGSYVFVSDPTTGTISTYQFDGSALTLAASISQSDVSALALSSDGTTLYAATSSGTINVYAVSANGGLSLTSTLTGSGSGSDLALSSDGLSLLLAGGSLTRYTSVQTLDLGETLTFADDLTLSDSNYDALNNGEGNYNGASITVTPSVTSGTFGFSDSSTLSLSNGVISQNGSAIATLSVSSSGVLTVTFTADVSTAVANQVLQQLTYTNSVATPGSLIQLSVTSADATLSSDAILLTLRANSVPVLNTDASTGYSLSAVTSETAYSFTLLANLFTDADGDALTWTVSGLPEGMTFDAKTRTISGSTSQVGTFTLTVTVTDASGASASLSLDMVVGQIANRAPELNSSASTSLTSAVENTAYSITVDSSLFNDPDSVYGDTLTWTVSGLPDGLSFDATTMTITGTATTVANYTVTVKVTDASGVSASAELTLRVISEAEANNSAPVITTDAISLTYSSEGALSGYSYYVNSITLSDDGSLLTIAGSTSSSGNGTSYLSVYSRDTTTGALTLIQTFTQGTADDGDDSNGIEVNGLNGVTSITYSADSSMLYVSGYSSSGSTSSYTITVFSVDSDGTGLTLVGSVANISEKVLSLQVSDNGNALYALSATSVYAYTIGDDGALSAIATYSGKYTAAVALQVDEDGTVYVLSSSSLTIYTANSDNSLSYAGQLLRSGTTLTYTDSSGTATTTTLSNANILSGATSMVVSDAGYVYLVTTNGYLTTLQYDVSANTVTLSSAISAYTTLGNAYPHGITLSADGTALYVVGGASSTLAIYAIGSDGIPVLDSTVSISGGATRIVVSADGTSIYAGPNLYFAPGLRVISADSSSQAYVELGTLNLTEGLTISDVDYDALNSGAGNYNGASISVVRTSGADSSDTYGFTEANGLTLSDGVISLNGNAIATFSSVDGTLTITFTADVSTATANLVAKQITYTNTSHDPGSSIALTLSVGDEFTSTSMSLALSVTETNDAPTLTTSNSSVTYSVGGNAIKVFDETAVSTIESGQTVTSLTLTVSDIVDGSQESLTLGNTSVALVDGTTNATLTLADGSTASFSVTVTISGSTATVVISSTSGLSATAAAALVDSLGYANASDSATVGTRTVTLTSITDSGGTSNGGTDTSTLAISSTVTLSLSNSAPTLSATAASATYVENASAVALFSDVVLSTGEAGQAISSLTLTISGVVDGSSETLTVDGTVITLVDGSSTTTSGYSYSVTVVDGTATLVISSTSGISVSRATALIAGIAYSHSSDDPTAGSRSVTLTAIQDDGGTRNGSTDTTALAISASVNVVAVNDAPVVEGTAQTVTYNTSASVVTLFSDVTLSTVESAQSISTVSFTVSGVIDGANETLTLDGTRISLVAGSGSTEHYSYTVTLSGDTATVVISSTSGMSTNDAAALINASRYSNLSNTQTDGVRSISVSVQDNGGVANGGADSATLSNSASVTIINNSAPVLSAGVDDNTLRIIDDLTTISGLGTLADSALTTAGDYLYVLDSSGNVAIFSRNTASGDLVLLQTLSSGVSSATTLVISEDGSHVYVLASDGSSVAILSRDSSDGSLIPSQTLVTQNVVDLAVSSDGTSVYLVDGNYSGLLVYTLDSDSGEYTLSQSIAAATGSEPYLFSAVSVTAVGDYVYVVTDPTSSSVANTLIVYKVGSDGQLSAVSWIRDGQTADDTSVDLSTPVDVAVSSDGSTVYVANSESVAVFSFNADSGTLIYLGSLSTADNVTVTSIALSSDDATLYLTGSDGSISRYSTANGTLTLLQTLSSSDDSTLAGAQDVIAAANGAVIVIGSNGLVSMTDTLADEITLPYTEQNSSLISGMLSLQDADYDALNSGSGNYNGAVISLVREGSANSDDTYTLISGNGLTLTDGVVYLNDAAIATFVSSDGKLTLTFTADVSTATANAVLQQISYTNTSDDPPGTLRLTLSVSDAYAASASTTLVLNVTTINDAPTVTASGVNSSQTEATETALFNDVVVSTVESEQAITSLTLTVTGVLDNAEYLTVDGSVINLSTDSSTTTGNGLNVSVVIDNGTATVTIVSSDGLSADAAQTLISGLRYSNDSSAISVGVRTITLSAAQDNGGTENGGVDSAVLKIAATVTLTNSAPHATDGNSISLSTTTDADFSTTLASDLFTDLNGDTLTWSVQNLPQGLSFDSQTLTLSGQVSTAGTYTLQVTVTDAGGLSATRTVTLTVVSSAMPPVTTDPDTTPDEPAVDEPDEPSGDDATEPSVDDPTVPPVVSPSEPADVSPTVSPVIPPMFAAPMFRSPGFTDPAFNEPAFASLNDAPNDIPLSRSDSSVQYGNRLAQRLALSQGIATAGTTLADQIDSADGLHSETRDSTSGSAFVLVGSTLVSQVEAATDGSNTVTLKVPAQLPDGSTVTRITLANGLPLPKGVRFDARTGQLHIDRATLTRQGTLRLTVTGRDGEGHETKTPLQVHSERPTAPSTRPNASRESQPDATSESVSTQLREAAPSALLDEARALLDSLSGLNTSTAAPVRTNA